MCDASFQPNVLKTTRKGVNVWNWARQRSSLIVLAVLRSPASITRSRAAKWGRIPCLRVVLRVNWSIKISDALIPLKASPAMCDQPLDYTVHCALTNMLI